MTAKLQYDYKTRTSKAKLYSFEFKFDKNCRS